jgi:membrane protein
MASWNVVACSYMGFVARTNDDGDDVAVKLLGVLQDEERTRQDGTARHRGRIQTWGLTLRQSVVDLRTSHATEWAGAIAFYALLSCFPLLLLGAALASYVVEPSRAVARLTALIGEFLPAGTVEIEAIVDDAIAERDRIGLFAVVTWIVTGRRVMSVLVSALNRVSDRDERTDPIKWRLLVELVLLTGVGALFLLALSARPILDLLWSGAEALPGAVGPVHGAAELLVRALLLLVAFSAPYAIVPQGERRRRPVLLGAAAASLLFLLAHAGFVFAMAGCGGTSASSTGRSRSRRCC